MWMKIFVLFRCLMVVAWWSLYENSSLIFFWCYWWLIIIESYSKKTSKKQNKKKVLLIHLSILIIVYLCCFSVAAKLKEKREAKIYFCVCVLMKSHWIQVIILLISSSKSIRHINHYFFWQKTFIVTVKDP